jgi:hypothetical protein
MQSAKLVLTSSVLMVGILSTAAARQIGEHKASAAEGAKQGIATTFVMAGKVKIADSFRAATPADSSSTKLIYFSSGKVAAAFAKGEGAVAIPGQSFSDVLFKGERVGQNFALHADRREKPGAAEIHAVATDVVTSWMELPPLSRVARSSIPRLQRPTKFVGPPGTGELAPY